MSYLRFSADNSVFNVFTLVEVKICVNEDFNKELRLPYFLNHSLPGLTLSYTLSDVASPHITLVLFVLPYSTWSVYL